MEGLSQSAPHPDQAPKTPVVRHHIDHPSARKVSDFRTSTCSTARALPPSPAVRRHMIGTV